MLTLKIDNKDIRKQLADMKAEALQAIGDAIWITQMSQVRKAFNNGGQPSKKWPKIRPPKGSYREGGEALRDTGKLMASFFHKGTTVTPGRIVSVIASSSKVAPFQHRGFSTNGPNFIPLTLRAKRLHRKGKNPKLEGGKKNPLKLGVDYIMAWKGVTVPARPMIDYADPVNKAEIEAEIIEAFKGQ